MPTNDKITHIPVLFTEAIKSLDIQPDDIVVDGTLGGASHAYGLGKYIDKGLLIGIDNDKDSLLRAKKRLDKLTCKVKTVHGNFKDISTHLQELKVKKVDKILLDLGWNIDQFADNDRGFSFNQDGPLDMRYNQNDEVTAYDIVNKWPEHLLADTLYIYGDETLSKKIAKRLVTERKVNPVNSTKKLAKIIEEVYPNKRHHIHPATKSFQALRIATNDEYGALKQFLKEFPDILKPCGRVSIITFHSGEDRIVKNAFRDLQKNHDFQLINKKPVTPTVREVSENKRARSAKLRTIEKLC